jgi:hemerythrin
MELVNRINAVTEMGHKSASKEETQKTIDLLEAYVIKHFGDEEALQRQSNYPQYDYHAKQHQIFIREFRDLKKEFAENGNSPRFTLKLNSSLINWVVRHIKTADVELGKYLKANG